MFTVLCVRLFFCSCVVECGKASLLACFRMCRPEWWQELWQCVLWHYLGGCAHLNLKTIVVHRYAVIYPIHGDKKVDGAIAIAMVC